MIILGTSTIWVPVLLLLAAAPTAWLGLLAWQRRRAPGALALALTAGVVTAWCVLAAVDSTSSNPAVKLILSNLEYVCQALLPVLWLLVVLDFIGSHSWLRRAQASLFVIPAVTVALALTTPFLNTTAPVTASTPLNNNPWFWVQSAYSILLLAASLVWLARAWLSAAALQRGQLAMLLACMLLPLAWIAVGELELANATPVVLALCTLVLVWGLFSFRLFDLAPLAQAAIMNGLSEAVVVIDLDQRIVDFNPVAAELLGWARAELRPGRGQRGQPAAQALAGWPELAELVCGAPETQDDDSAVGLTAPPTELARGLGAARRVYKLHLAPLADPQGRPVGQLLTLRDDTERRRIEDELARLATTDELTGLADQARAFEALQDEIIRTRRYASTLSLLTMDLDHFKALNQALGRPAGDEALRRVARAMQRLARQSDLPARPGSDEFILVLPHTNLLGAETVAGRLLAAVSQIEPGPEQPASDDQPPAPPLTLSISIGAAELASDDDEHGEALLARAEKALRAAKAAGGGRVMVDEGERV